MEAKETELNFDIPIDVDALVLKYFKIFALNFIIALAIITLINVGVVIAKIFGWWQQEIYFWNSMQNIVLSLSLFFCPIIYAVWFYFLTSQKILRQLHEDFIKKLNKAVAPLMSAALLDWYRKGKNSTSKFDIDQILLIINQQLAKLPKILRWLAKKILDRIPLLSIASSYEPSDLENESKDMLASYFEEKLNEAFRQEIDAFVPNWTYYLLPANLLLIAYYYFM